MSQNGDAVLTATDDVDRRPADVSPGMSAGMAGGMPGGSSEGVLSSPSARPPGNRKIRLGEELPVFCERCGYSLNGLIQNRCEACRVLQFSCPECGHHQPINTLRPAVQRLLGTLRARALATIVFLKINFFFWPLIGAGGLGGELAYSYNYLYNGGAGSRYGPARFENEGGVLIFLFAFAFAAIGRMLLLRWRRGPLVGLALAGLIVLAMVFGAHLRQSTNFEPMPSPLTEGFLAYLFFAFTGAWLGAACVWGIWLSLAHAFLPKKTAEAMIEWQRAMSMPGNRSEKLDAAASVTV